MKPDPKTLAFPIKFSAEDKAMLDDLVQAWQVSKPAVVRRLIREAHAELRPKQRKAKR